MRREPKVRRQATRQEIRREPKKMTQEAKTGNLINYNRKYLNHDKIYRAPV